MWKFSKRSTERLATAHPILVECFTAALKISPVDFGISCGHRDEKAQLIAYQEGKSNKLWPDGKHNKIPSEAVDFFPYVAERGVVWGDTEKFYLIAGLVIGIAHQKGFRLRWGGAWSGLLNQTRVDRGERVLQDLPHIEILL
jgi:peptidoglycan L-alanyl-D-glutamate endopeptidase CwlK